MLVRGRLRTGLLLLLLLFVFLVAAENPLPEPWLFLIRVFRLLLLLLLLLLGAWLVRRGTRLLVRHRRGWGRFLPQAEDLLDEIAVIGHVLASVFGLGAGEESRVIVVGARRRGNAIGHLVE